VACITAIGVNDKKNIVVDLPDRLHPNFAVVSTIVLLLQRGAQEDARGIFEPKTRSAKVRRLLASSHAKSMAGSYTL
jgi:hypothetical protein